MPKTYFQYINENFAVRANRKEVLSISKPNAKIPHYYLSLPAGWSCPGADKCLAKVDRETGKLSDGPNSIFRCYAASTENLFPNARKSRNTNMDLLVAAKTPEKMAVLLEDSLGWLPRKERVFRIHEGGDFFNENYFKAWIIVAKDDPRTLYYGYTKSIKYWVNNLDSIPPNMKLNASYGGKHDDLIAKHNLKYIKVVFSMEEAEAEGLEVDKDDSLAWNQDKPFAQLLHGRQKSGSDASLAMSALRKQGIKGYSADRDGRIDKEDGMKPVAAKAKATRPPVKVKPVALPSPPQTPDNFVDGDLQFLDN